ncbi:Variant-specific surface protein, partial [Giardia duodenalis]
VLCCSVNLDACSLQSLLVTRCCESVPRAAACYWTLLSGSTCTSCEANNGSIAGVSGCLSCAAPTGNTGPVLCYLVGMAAGLISSRLCGYVCSDCSCHRYRQPPAGCVTWWQSAPRGSEQDAAAPAHRAPVAPPAEHTMHLICCPRLSEYNC